MIILQDTSFFYHNIFKFCTPITLYNLLHTCKKATTIFKLNKSKFETWYSVPLFEDKTKYHTYAILRSGKIIEKRYFYDKNYLRKIESYINDLLDGETIIYDQNHFLVLKKNYKKGQLDGIEELYDNNILVRRCNYKNGKLNGKFEEFYIENSNLKLTGTYKDDMFIGWKTSFYQDGSMKSLYWFNRHGQIHGTFKELYRSGALKIEGTYNENMKNGKFIYFKDSSKINQVDKIEIYVDDILIK